MSARLLQVLLAPCMMGLMLAVGATLPPRAPQPLVLPPAAPERLEAMPLPAAWLPSSAAAPADNSIQQLLQDAPPLARLTGMSWQARLPQPAITLTLQAGERLLYARQSPPRIIPRPPAAQAAVVILPAEIPAEKLGAALLAAGHMGAFQAGWERGVGRILLLDGEGHSWVTPRMLPRVRWPEGDASFQILQRVCQMGQPDARS